AAPPAGRPLRPPQPLPSTMRLARHRSADRLRRWPGGPRESRPAVRDPTGAGPPAAPALIEHRQCFRFVRLHSGHRLGLRGRAELILLREGSGREREGDDRDDTDHAVTKHEIPPVVWGLTHCTPLTCPRERVCPDV